MVRRTVAMASLAGVLVGCAGQGAAARAAPVAGSGGGAEAGDVQTVCRMEAPTGSHIARPVCSTTATSSRERLHDDLVGRRAEVRATGLQ